ncbi:alpha/beta hydrolase fold domain-containing protein [Brachybacterium sp. Z12]|uniref:alpha/beta hydrolase n=1 Tax=Brachybacterium sp. Z12 TaxID=2759167 RepID=UPI00185FDE31|nr:alpha/beta hydrolase [Brachybacterium sp. Z12]QNN82355.1 alpha/beta hydrolase fold domain-containing protein [Brachybacterium sp. Z12]
MTVTAPAEMERRLRTLADATSHGPLSPQDEAAWNAPYGRPERWDLRIQDWEAPGPHGPVPVRVYTPIAPASGPRAVLVFCHGGSFQHGDLDMPEGDHTARGVAGRADAVVVSVDYRLCDEPAGGSPARQLPGTDPALEVRAPIPCDDVIAAVDWTRAHAEQLGIDPDRLALGGASAGGNLAAAASLRLAAQGRAPALSLLMYLVAHPLNPEATEEEAAALAELPEMLRFTPQKMRRMSENYLGGPLEDATAHDFPGLGTREQLSVLPRTYIESDEFDDLRTSARRYAEQLAEAGVEVEYEVRGGVTHGHLNKIGLPQAADSRDRMAALLKEI